MKNSVFFRDKWLIEKLLNLLVNREAVFGTQSYDVASGYSGYALVCIQASLYFAAKNDDVNAQLFASYARQELENAARTCSEEKDIKIGLFDGITGYVWVLHLYEELLNDDRGRSSRMLHGLRGVLEELLQSFLADGYRQYLADVISGFSGVITVCKAIDLSCGSSTLEKIIEHIEKAPLVGKDSLFFISNDSPSEILSSLYASGYVDFGVAHGVGGLLPRIFSAKTSDIGVQDNLLLQSLISLSCSVASDGVYSVDAGEVEDGGGGMGRAVTSGHWCYGELARIASIITLHNKGLSEENLESLLLRLKFLIDSGLAKKVGEQFLQTSCFGLCHGLSGYVFTLMYIAFIVENLGDLRLSQLIGDTAKGFVPILIREELYKDLQSEDCSRSGFLNGELGAISVLLSLENQESFYALSTLFFGFLGC